MISKIETGERPPAEDFPPRLDAVPELDTRGALTRLRDHLKKGHKQRLYGSLKDPCPQVLAVLPVVAGM